MPELRAGWMFGMEENRKMTKGDQIRQMTDKELTQMINKIGNNMCNYCKGCDESKFRCDEAVMNYLRSEVEQ